MVGGQQTPSVDQTAGHEKVLIIIIIIYFIYKHLSQQSSNKCNKANLKATHGPKKTNK